MSHKLLLALALCMPFLSDSAFAGDVVKWVDQNGVTHFGDAQFAPAEGAEKITIGPTNPMDETDTGILHRVSTAKPMNVVTVSREVRRNPRGWRGYNGRVSFSRAVGRLKSPGR